jgi:hypothetical protein
MTVKGVRKKEKTSSSSALSKASAVPSLAKLVFAFCHKNLLFRLLRVLKHGALSTNPATLPPNTHLRRPQAELPLGFKPDAFLPGFTKPTKTNSKRKKGTEEKLI